MPDDEVEVLAPVVVVEAHALAAHEQHRLAGVRRHVERRVERRDLVEELAHAKRHLALVCG